MSPTVMSFLRAALGCIIFEGYGQTECTAGCTFSLPGDMSTGLKKATCSFEMPVFLVRLLFSTALMWMSVILFFFLDHVGSPLPCAMVKLEDIPDMNYLVKNKQGEVSLCKRCDHIYRIFPASSEPSDPSHCLSR